MRLVRPLLVFTLSCLPAFSATFGTVVPGPGGASYSDLLLDEPRQRVYLVDSSASRIDVYSTQTKAFLSAIRTDTQPVSIAMSPDGKSLYATAYTGSVLDIIDLTQSSPAVATKIALPASPEGVAVGGDGRVLISTVGNAGNNVLLVFDPSAPSGKNLNNVAITPGAPTPPTLPAPSGTAFLSYHSKLIATGDGNYIIGNNITSTSTTSGRVVFVYSTASATVLRSRIVANLSNVLAVSPDGTKFMAGPALFNTATLSIVAQENTANSPFAFPANANFNTQANQGGSVFSPDGTSLWAAFNFAPVANPAVAANVSRLMVNDPDNLLIKLGLEVAENLSGRMIMSSAGDNIYALSQSGFMILPISALSQNPLAQTDSQVQLLTNDQCGVTAQTSQAIANVTNGGRGKLTVSVQTYTLPNTGVTGLGGAGGPGGTIIFNPGGGIIIGGIGVGGPGGTTTTTTTTTGTAPTVTTKPTSNGATLTFKFNPSAAKSLGTVAANDFLIQAPEAVNIAANLRVFQNNRNSDASGKILLTQQNISAAEALMDMVMDTARQRIYVANSGLNQIEVLDMKTQTLMNPIKVGQLPHSMALGSDGVTMYVANTGGESISIVDLDKMQATGSVTFPPIPANVAVAFAYPTAIANSERGPQFVMSDGSLWKIDGTNAIPRVLNPLIFGGSDTATVRTVSGGNPSQFSMAGTPAGEYVMMVTGAGNAYLYDASVDDYTKVQQIFTTPLTGFIGPIAAGPKGAYFVANGTLLNSSLTPIAGPPGSSPSTGTVGAATTGRPVSATAVISASTYALFTQPIRANTTATVTDAGEIQLIDATTGNPTRTVNSLEGPASTVTGTGRATIPGRTLIVDPTQTYAYAITTSGISVIPLSLPNAANTPRITANGVVNVASYQTAVAPGALVSIFGKGLGASASATGAPLPSILGGTCVTLNNQPIPLELTSDGQINAQIPVNLAAGRYPMVIRSIANLTESSATTVTVSKYAPAVFVSSTGQAAIVHAKDGNFVTPDNPSTRDQDLVIYATGLGVTTGGAVTSGNAAPSSPLAVTAPVSVYFGNPGYSQSPVIVEWSGLLPGFIGVNQINVRVPGTHMNGNALPVTIKIGGVSSPSSGPAVPTVALN